MYYQLSFRCLFGQLCNPILSGFLILKALILIRMKSDHAIFIQDNLKQLDAFSRILHRLYGLRAVSAIV